MSRPLRIEYPGAWYHVMNRGRRSEKIYFNEKDHLTFMELLIEACELWDVNVSAFSLMPNHYHLLVNTPLGNLSRFMRHLNGIYTQRLNKNHKTEGQLFKGRYKSILVDGDDYLLNLLRYIHRNPLSSKTVKNINDYKWSGHQGYISDSKDWKWLHKNFILSIFSDNKKEAVREYQEFVSENNDRDVVKMLEGKKWPSMFGCEEFIFSIKEKYYKDKIDIEVPESNVLSPDYTQIKNEVCSYFKIDKDELHQSRRNTINLPRNIAVYLSRILRRDPLDLIGQEYSLNRSSSVSSVLNRTKELINKDTRIQQIVEKIKQDIINKG